MRKQQIAIIALALWLTLVTTIMFQVRQVNLHFFLVLSVVGLLVIMQFIQSNFVQPGYMRHIRYIIAAGIVILCVIVGLKVLDILGWEITIR